MSLRSGSECSHVFGTSALATILLIPGINTQRVYLYRMLVTIGGAPTALMFQDTASNALSQGFQMLAGGAITFAQLIDGDPWFQSTTGLGIQFANPGGAIVGYDIWYLQGP